MLLRLRDILVRPFGLKESSRPSRPRGRSDKHFSGVRARFTTARSFSVKDDTHLNFVCHCSCSRHLKADPPTDSDHAVSTIVCWRAPTLPSSLPSIAGSCEASLDRAQKPDGNPITAIPTCCLSSICCANAIRDLSGGLLRLERPSSSRTIFFGDRRRKPWRSSRGSPHDWHVVVVYGPAVKNSCCCRLNSSPTNLCWVVRPRIYRSCGASNRRPDMGAPAQGWAVRRAADRRRRVARRHPIACSSLRSRYGRLTSSSMSEIRA